MNTKWIVVLCATAFACADVPTSPEPSLVDLRDAPTALVLDGIEVELEVTLWRDFMPIAPPNGQPLALVVRVPGGSPVAAVTTGWVLNNGDVWRASTKRVDQTRDWVGRDGPKWGPGIRVDVVLRVRAQSGREGYLRVPAVYIGRTD